MRIHALALCLSPRSKYDLHLPTTHSQSSSLAAERGMTRIRMRTISAKPRRYYIVWRSHTLSFLRGDVSLVNPRRACASRVTVLGLRVSWGAIFSVKGEKGGGRKGEKKGRGQRSKWGGKFKVKMQPTTRGANFCLSTSFWLLMLHSSLAI